MFRRASVQSMCAIWGEIKGKFPVLVEKHSNRSRSPIALIAGFLCFASSATAGLTRFLIHFYLFKFGRNLRLLSSKGDSTQFVYVEK